MAPTILVVGATGNTGRNVVSTLSSLIKSIPYFSSHRILGLTRSLSNPTAIQLATLPNVEIIEQDWVDITSSWLQSHNVVRAFIASHTETSQFTDETSFYLNALEAGLEYVVRISTTAANVRPDVKAYYARTHWAIETFLETKQLEGLKWSSLQPNVFTEFFLGGAAELVKKYRKTGELDTLKLVASKDAPVGIIGAGDVGVFAAHLLLEEDVSKQNRQKYVLNGPEDITGEEIVKLVEGYIGVKIPEVVYKDTSFVDWIASTKKEGKSAIMTLKYAQVTGWEGLAKAETTSKAVLEHVAAPKTTPAETFKRMVDGN